MRSAAAGGKTIGKDGIIRNWRLILLLYHNLGNFVGLTEGWKCNACTQIVVPQQIIPVLKASPVPATGDKANPVIWCVMVLMSAVGMSFAVGKTKKI